MFPNYTCGQARLNRKEVEAKKYLSRKPYKKIISKIISWSN